MFGQAFAQDVDPAQAKVIAAEQKPFSKSILTEKSGPPAWKQLPSWYQVSENDHAIPPDVERMFAKQINATTISLPSLLVIIIIIVIFQGYAPTLCIFLRSSLGRSRN